MLEIQIDGIFTYADNVKTLKLNDQVKLRRNPNNRINKEAIAVYTMTNLKVGYIPFKSSQIDINSKYTVSKISLNQHNPIVIISREYNITNFIEIEDKINNYTILDKHPYQDDLIAFKKKLYKTNKILTCGITYFDNNFINLLIQTDTEAKIFYLVTRKYYEDNIFKYDEFYNYNLIPNNIYLPFQIHRLEMYIEKNYNNITNFIKNKKLIDYIEKNKFELGPEEINLDNYKKGGMCVNHKLKAYCNIDYYNEQSVIVKESNDIIYFIMQMVISNKTVLYLLKENFTLQLKINDNNLRNISDIFM